MNEPSRTTCLLNLGNVADDGGATGASSTISAYLIQKWLRER